MIEVRVQYLKTIVFNQHEKFENTMCSELLLKQEILNLKS